MNWLISAALLALSLLALGLRRLYELGRIAGEAYVESCMRFGEVGPSIAEAAPAETQPFARHVLVHATPAGLQRLAWVNGLQVYSDLFDEADVYSLN